MNNKEQLTQTIMKKYEINLDSTTSTFFEEIALITKRPIEELLADALFKQVEIIQRKATESFEAGNKQVNP